MRKKKNPRKHLAVWGHLVELIGMRRPRVGLASGHWLTGLAAFPVGRRTYRDMKAIEVLV